MLSRYVRLSRALPRRHRIYYSTSSPDMTVEHARTACLTDLLNTAPSFHLLQAFYPEPCRPAVLSIFSLATYLHTLSLPSPHVTTQPARSNARANQDRTKAMQAIQYEFHRNKVTTAFLDPKKALASNHPYTVLLASHLENPRMPPLTQAFFTKMISTAQAGPTGAMSLEKLEAYGEGAETTRLYLLLESLGYRDQGLDHVASHLGKARGLLNGVVFLPGFVREGRCSLPVDLMTREGCVEEELYRLGPNAKGATEVVQAIVDQVRGHLNSVKKELKGEKRAWPVWLEAVDMEYRVSNVEKKWWGGGLQGAGAARLAWAWWRRKL